jgi:hypothetical protein
VVAAATTPLAARASAPAGHLGNAREISLTALGATGNSRVSHISCASPDNCTAEGSYEDAAGQQAFVISEKNGTWGKSEAIPGLKSLNTGGNAFVRSLFCATPGNCAAGGSYQDGSHVEHAFIADSVNGTWQKAKNFDFTGIDINPGPDFDFRVNSVWCAAPGKCSAALGVPVVLPGSSGTTSGEAFVASSSAGRWGPPKPLPGVQALNTGLSAETRTISCSAPDTCVAGGDYMDASQIEHPFIATETHGKWGAGVGMPGITGVLGYNPQGHASSVRSVTCLRTGYCAASGFYSDAADRLQAFVSDRRNGSWHTQAVPGAIGLAAHGVENASVSCGSDGDCAVASDYLDASSFQHSLVAAESGGVWRNAQQIGGNGERSAGLGSVSCYGGGGCTVGAGFTDAAGIDQAFIEHEKAGTWGGVQLVAGNLNTVGAAVNVVSCPRFGTCAIGGDFNVAPAEFHAFIADLSPATATSLTLSRRRVAVGHEHSERLTVKVTARTGGTPAGKVTIKAGSATVCTVTLASGKGECRLKARQLRRGTYHLTATYRGSQHYAVSVSAKKTLTVTR